MRSKQELAVFLSKLKGFEQPNAQLEQYPTDSEIAASILWDAYMQYNVEGKRIADFGCGTGVLGIGALALGAKYVTFIELDSSVFPVLMENLALLEKITKKTYSNYEIIEGNVSSYNETADVIFQNPPFGTREEHADMVFLRKAIKLAPLTYSLHKTATKKYVLGHIEKAGAQVKDTHEYEFPLKNTMAHHSKQLQRVAVTCFVIER